MSNYFKVKEHGSTVRTEIMAGVTTFMAMAYILMVNAGMFASLGTVSYGAIYIATAISAVIGTVLIGLLANLPLAQASGMGLNAFFVYTVCFTFGLSYANGLVLVLVDGKDGDQLTARTEGGRLVRFPGDERLIGQFTQVTITGSTTWSLTGALA